MRKTCVLIALVGIAACARPEAEANAVKKEVESAAEASPAAMEPGLYTVGDETTAYGTTRLLSDGTYEDYGPDAEIVGGGSWRSHPGGICFDPAGDGEDQKERCWTNGPASEDGSFMTTLEDGSQSYRVTPIDEDKE